MLLSERKLCAKEFVNVESISLYFYKNYGDPVTSMSEIIKLGKDFTKYYFNIIFYIVNKFYIECMMCLMVN